MTSELCSFQPRVSLLFSTVFPCSTGLLDNDIGRSWIWFTARFVAGFWVCLIPVTAVFGGGGPENVFVVVNSGSWASRTVANHFCQLREIPPTNVFYVDWKYSVDSVSIDVFRKNLLRPIFERIAKRKLANQIDYIVYSSDFPFAVDVRADIKPSPKFHYGSLTGLTYLAERVLTKDRSYFGVTNNFYADPSPNSISRGFRSSRRWAAGPPREGAVGHRYFLSTMLAYTCGRGNSIEEVKNS